ncbi:MAG: molybdenum cofactor biosynthesis protein MoaE [Cocleimonas sp.]|nr:molybdenum cofactor biosynthesis protein MoaE [Cocleimonas sp.]
MKIKISTKDFDPFQEIKIFQNATLNLSGKSGATSIFIGTMRDMNDGNVVEAMTLEHYPGMTEKQIEIAVSQAQQQWQINDMLILHRVGEVMPDQTIVLVAVWASHRGDAFDACRYIIETLKSRAPFWKKEKLITNEERWVSKNTDGYR